MLVLKLFEKYTHVHTNQRLTMAAKRIQSQDYEAWYTPFHLRAKHVDA
jgi:hypothetical protein